MGELIAWVGEAAFWGSAGLLVGWNVLPQPAFVKAGWTWVAAKFAD